jgi:hypothetical protein
LLSQLEEPKRVFAEWTLNAASMIRARTASSSPKRQEVVDQGKTHFGDWRAAIDAKQAVTRQVGGVTGDVVSKASSIASLNLGIHCS